MDERLKRERERDNQREIWIVRERGREGSEKNLKKIYY